MRLLVLGHGGLNDLDRVDEIRRLGHEVTCEALYPGLRNRYEQFAFRWAVQMRSGPWITQVNHDLIQRAADWKSFDLIWVEKAQYIKETTIEALRDITRTPIVHFTPDIAIRVTGTPHSKIFHDAISAYDALVTTKDFEVPLYRKLGASRVLFMEKAVSHRRFFPRTDVPGEFRSRIGLIAHFEQHYLDTVRKIAVSGLPVKVRGPGWDAPHRRFNPWYRAFNGGGPIRGEGYALSLSGMEIGLGLLMKLGPEVVTARSLEVPACGTFLLAERTHKHQELFEEGKDAEFFSSVEELVDKARFYLEHATARQRIARSGFDRFMSGPARLDRQVALLMEQLTSIR